MDQIRLSSELVGLQHPCYINDTVSAGGSCSHLTTINVTPIEGDRLVSFCQTCEETLVGPELWREGRHE